MAGVKAAIAVDDAAIRVLLSWKQDRPGERVTWKALRVQLDVSRQALAKKPAVAAAYLKVRKAKGKTFDPSNSRHVQRRARECLIESLKKEIEAPKSERTAWIAHNTWAPTLR